MSPLTLPQLNSTFPRFMSVSPSTSKARRVQPSSTFPRVRLQLWTRGAAPWRVSTPNVCALDTIAPRCRRSVLRAEPVTVSKPDAACWPSYSLAGTMTPTGRTFLRSAARSCTTFVGAGTLCIRIRNSAGRRSGRRNRAASCAALTALADLSIAASSWRVLRRACGARGAFTQIGATKLAVFTVVNAVGAW